MRFCIFVYALELDSQCSLSSQDFLTEDQHLHTQVSLIFLLSSGHGLLAFIIPQVSWQFDECQLFCKQPMGFEDWGIWTQGFSLPSISWKRHLCLLPWSSVDCTRIAAFGGCKANLRHPNRRCLQLCYYIAGNFVQSFTFLHWIHHPKRSASFQYLKCMQ